MFALYHGEVLTKDPIDLWCSLLLVSSQSTTNLTIEDAKMTSFKPLTDNFGRKVSYLRLSVTDRCDFRCHYCMAEEMTFLPKSELLTLEEMDRLVGIFVRRGLKKLRLTGGEPLVRRNIIWLINNLSKYLGNGLQELTLTTNGSQLPKFAHDLKAAGIDRINISLDSLDPIRFREITRRGDLAQVLEGIKAADHAGLKIKLNMVALRGVNDDEFDSMITFCGERGYDLTLIETMPLGEVDFGRVDHYLSLADVRKELSSRWTLTDDLHQSGGPARYLRIVETGQRLGLITPLSQHFCESCNRVRLTATGTLYLCLGQEDHVDLRELMRQYPDDDSAIHQQLDLAMSIKPRGHEFLIDQAHNGPAIPRFMSTTGG